MKQESNQQVVVPVSHDILCGSGDHVKGQEGNRVFHQVLRSHQAAYAEATTKQQKMRVARRIFDESTRTGSRFLKKDPIYDRWYLASNKAAKDKISHCLRKMRRVQERGGETVAVEVPAPHPLLRNNGGVTMAPSAVVSADDTSSTNNAPNYDSSIRSPHQPEQVFDGATIPQQVPAFPAAEEPSLLVDSTTLMLQAPPIMGQELHSALQTPKLPSWYQQAAFAVLPFQDESDLRRVQQQEGNALNTTSEEEFHSSMQALCASKQSAFQICEALKPSHCFDAAFFPAEEEAFSATSLFSSMGDLYIEL